MYWTLSGVWADPVGSGIDRVRIPFGESVSEVSNSGYSIFQPNRVVKWKESKSMAPLTVAQDSRNFAERSSIWPVTLQHLLIHNSAEAQEGQERAGGGMWERGGGS